MLLSMEHPSVMSSPFSPNVIEIRVREDFSEFLTEKRYWTWEILDQLLRFPAFLITDHRDREILFRLFIADIEEVAFRKNVITIWIKEANSWVETFREISELFQQENIVPCT